MGRLGLGAAGRPAWDLLLPWAAKACCTLSALPTLWALSKLGLRPFCWQAAGLVSRLPTEARDLRRGSPSMLPALSWVLYEVPGLGPNLQPAVRQETGPHKFDRLALSQH